MMTRWPWCLFWCLFWSNFLSPPFFSFLRALNQLKPCARQSGCVGSSGRTAGWMEASHSGWGWLYPLARLAMNLAAKKRQSNLALFSPLLWSGTAHCSWHYTIFWWLASAPNKVLSTCDINFRLCNEDSNSTVWWTVAFKEVKEVSL